MLAAVPTGTVNCYRCSVCIGVNAVCVSAYGRAVSQVVVLVIIPGNFCYLFQAVADLAGSSSSY